MPGSDRTRTLPSKRAAAAQAVDAGLRRYMLAIYNKVALGLGVAAGAAYLTSGVPFVRDELVRAASHAAQPSLTLPGVILVMSPLILLVSAGPLLRAPTPRGAAALYWSVVALMGAGLGLVVQMFSGASVVSAFLASAGAFGALSLYGYGTRRDLTGLGSFMVMGLFGLIGGLVLNLVLHSPVLQHVITTAGVLVFGGLIAHDTQRLKLAYGRLNGDPAAIRTTANLGALSLFVNFINLFQMLLLITGDRR